MKIMGVGADQKDSDRVTSDGSNDAKPAVGFGPNRGGDFSQEDYQHPAAGWGAATSVSKVLLKQGELIDGARAVFKMNHENGGYLRKRHQACDVGDDPQAGGARFFRCPHRDRINGMDRLCARGRWASNRTHALRREFGQICTSELG